MSTTNTNIRLQRSVNTLSELANVELNFGEPIFVDNTVHDTSGFISEPCTAYLAIGRKPDSPTDSITVEKSPVIKAFSKNKVDRFVFYDPTRNCIVDESDIELPVNRITASSIDASSLDPTSAQKYYILCQPENDNSVVKFTLDELGIFVGGNGVMRGAAWNDYAEFRKVRGDVNPGMVVCDSGDGFMEISSSKLQSCAHVVSDSYGQIIGEEDGSAPIAVAGRVKVFCKKDDQFSLGDCVCADKGGVACKMSRQEIAYYPDRILGVVCEIPKDDDNRIWINVK